MIILNDGEILKLGREKEQALKEKIKKQQGFILYHNGSQITHKDIFRIDIIEEGKGLEYLREKVSSLNLI